MRTILDLIDMYIEENKEVSIETESEVLTGIIQARGDDFIEFKKVSPEIRRCSIFIFPISRIMSIGIEE